MRTSPLRRLPAALAAVVVAAIGCSGTQLREGRCDELGSASIAGIAIDTWGDLPEWDQLMRWVGDGTIDDFDELERPLGLLIRDLPYGEVKDLTIEFLDVALSDATTSDDELLAKEQSPARVMGVVASLRDPPTLVEAQARHRFELRELVALTGHGALFRTTREPWLAIPLLDFRDELRLGALAVAYDPEFLRYGDRIAIEDAPRLMREAPGRFEPLAWTLEVAEKAGSTQGAALRAEFLAAATAAVAPHFDAIVERCRAGAFEERVIALREAVESFQAVKKSSGAEPASMRATLDSLRAGLERDLRVSAADTLARGPAYEAAALDAVAATIAEADARPDDLRRRLLGAEGVLPVARELDSMTLSQRVVRHGDLQREAATDAPVAVHRFASRARARLAAELEEAARAAAANGLHATACGRWLMAYGARHGRHGRDVGTATLYALHGADERAGESALAKARREALLLARRLVPLVSPASLEAAKCESAWDDGALLRRMPVATRLGLATGDRWAHELLAVVLPESERFELEITPPEIALAKEERTERVTKTLHRTRLVSNRPALAAWSNRLIGIESAIDALNAAIELDRYASNQVTSTLGFTDYEFVSETHDTVTYRERRMETASSMQRRAESLGAIPAKLARIDELNQEHARLLANRPPDLVEEVTSRVVDYPRHVQAWKVHVARTARLAGPETTNETAATQEFELAYARVSPDAGKELEGVDEWRTEEELRADRGLWDAARPAYARLALKNLFDWRLARIDAGIEARDLSEIDELTERRWLQYLFRDPVVEDDPTLAEQLTRQDALVDAAFAGEGEPLPLEAPAWVPATPLIGEINLAMASVTGSPTLDEVRAAAAASWEAGDHPASAALFHYCVSRNPQDVVAWACLAGSFGEIGEWRNAIESYRKASTLAPDWSGGRLHAALLHALLGDWEAASLEYDAGLAKTTPEDLAAAREMAARYRDRFTDPALYEKVEARLSAKQ